MLTWRALLVRSSIGWSNWNLSFLQTLWAVVAIVDGDGGGRRVVGQKINLLTRHECFDDAERCRFCRRLVDTMEYFVGLMANNPASDGKCSERRAASRTVWLCVALAQRRSRRNNGSRSWGGTFLSQHSG
jgi:hypothetical protein